MRDWKQIVWIASYPKSGNTWVRCFLDAYFLGEVDINDLLCSVSDDNGVRAALGGDSHTDIMDEPVEIVMMTKQMALLRLIDAYLQTDVKGIPLFVKTHNANVIANGVELLPERLTKATIHIVRDPRHVLPSFANHTGADLDSALESMTDVYRVLDGRKQRKIPDMLSSWGKHLSSFTGSDMHNVLTVRYEDMVAQPVHSFSSILRHSGINPDASRVESALALVELGKLKAQEEKNGFGEQSHKARGVFFGGEREKIQPRHIYRLERRFKTQMRSVGYLPKKSKLRAA